MKTIATALVALYACFALTVLLSPSGTPQPASVYSVNDVLVSVTAVGGECPEGACEAAFTIHDNGTWTISNGGNLQQGTLTPSDLASLTDAVATAQMQNGPPFTELCPTAYDGSEFTYTFTQGGETFHVGSCDVLIPSNDPLVTAIESLQITNG